MIDAKLIDAMGTDLTVCQTARVSFSKASEWECTCGNTQWVHDYDYGHYCGSCNSGDSTCLSAKDTKLIKYLASHKHMSPFGHCFASFHVKAPVFVARQLVKHKFLRINEVSRRYVSSDPEFYTPDVWRGVAKDKKQGSAGDVSDVYDMPEESAFGYSSITGDVHNVNQCASEGYRHLLSCGVAPEQARIVLPQSLMTEWYWSGSMDAFADMCNLRCTDDTQSETRLVADVIEEVMLGLYPVSWKALRG